MAVDPDYWAVLGLAPGADAATLKRTFREQARRWHPDLNGNDPVAEERFKRVNEAYAVLSDPKRRQAWEAGQDPLDSHSGSADRFATTFPDFEEYLDALLGRRPSEPEPADSGAPAGDAPTRQWPFEDRAGRSWRVSSSETFASGSPSADPFPTSTGFVDGQPTSVDVTHAPPPPPPVRAAADLETQVDLTPEQALTGTRLELELPDGLMVELWTPPLAGDGWRLRLEGVAPGGGDHFLQLRVRTDEGLRIDGLRVLYQLELSPAEAALGCHVVVPTLEGEVQLRVPSGSSSGRLLRLRGRGLAQADQRGDQLVEIRIMVPERLSEAEAALYRRLEELAEQESGA